MTRPLFRTVSATSRGYTAVEVLMAMTVMAIGGAAVITMQKTSVTANLDARKADVANAIARTWVERLQRDAMAWTLPGPGGNGNNIGNTLIVGNVVNNANAWFLPANPPTPGTWSPAFDILGRDVALANADFCVNVRLNWLTNTGVPPGGDLIRADVRVIWPVGIFNSAPNFCNPATAALDDPNSADPNALLFHAIYLTTSIKENAQ